MRYGIAAGDGARDRYAGHRAISAYRQALAALEQSPPETVREFHTLLLERLGRALLVVDRHDSAEETFQRMLEAAGSTGDRGSESRALSWISFVRRRRYNLTGAREAAEAALQAAAEVGEPRLLALAHWGLGQVHETAGELDDSINHAHEAERLARAEGDRDVLARSLLIRGHAAIWRGRFGEGQRCAEEAVALARADRDSLVITGSLWRLGLALGEAGRFGAARKELLAGIALAEANGVVYYLAKLLNTVGWLHLELGDHGEAAIWDRRALETARGAPRTWLPRPSVMPCSIWSPTNWPWVTQRRRYRPRRNWMGTRRFPAKSNTFVFGITADTTCCEQRSRWPTTTAKAHSVLPTKQRK